MLAWRTYVVGIESIVFAPTRAKARYTTHCAAKESRFCVSWTEIDVRRAPEYDDYDALVPKLPTNRCWSEEIFQINAPEKERSNR